MGDLTKNFSRYEVQCSCGCGASWASSKLLEKLQHVHDVVNKPMTITSGVRCESFNASIKGSLVSSHMPDADGMGLAVDIACTSSKVRYEMVDVAIKFFRRIGIAGEHSGSFIYLDIDPKKNAGRYLDLLRIEKTPLTRSSRGKGEKGFNLLQV